MDERRRRSATPDFLLFEGLFNCRAVRIGGGSALVLAASAQTETLLSAQMGTNQAPPPPPSGAAPKTASKETRLERRSVLERRR